ncbi:MAG: hypothetical protein E7131_07140 [Rikenellaceae bacterium]|nr:hypothetical protein [Rikenellaceae bacterium]
MKKLIHFCLLVVLVTSCSTDHRIIDNPYIESATSQIYDVTRVELTDTATIVHLEAHYLPGWWIMPLRAMCLRVDGEKYTATRLEGANFDERFWMHPDGHAPMIATFPPIPKGAKAMDLFNGYYEIGTERLFGIDLTGRKRTPKYHKDLPRKFRKPIDKGEVELPELSYKVGESEMRLHLLGYRDSLMDNRVVIVVKNIFDDMGVYYSTVDTEGNLSFRIPLYGTSLIQIGYLGAYNRFHFYIGASHNNLPAHERIYHLYIDPGEVTDVYIDLTKRGEWLRNRRNGVCTYDMGIYTSGRYAEVNRQMNNLPYQVLMDPLPRLHNFIDYRVSTEEYIAHVTKCYHECRDSIASAKDLTPLQKRISTVQLNEEYVSYAANPEGVLRGNFCWGGGRNYQYYSKLPDSVKLAEFTLEQKRGMVREMGLTGDLSVLEQLADIKLARVCTVDELGYKFDFYNDVAHARRPYRMIIQHKQLDSVSVERIKEIKTKEVVTMLNDMITEDQKQVVEAAESVVFEPTPQGEAKEVFDAIVARHKGKVVVLRNWYYSGFSDFPSLHEVRREVDLRRETSEQGVVWIDLNYTYPYEMDDPSRLAGIKRIMMETTDGLHYILHHGHALDIFLLIDKESEHRRGPMPQYYIVDKQGNAEPQAINIYGNRHTDEDYNGVRDTDRLRRIIEEKLNE